MKGSRIQFRFPLTKAVDLDAFLADNRAAVLNVALKAAMAYAEEHDSDGERVAVQCSAVIDAIDQLQVFLAKPKRKSKRSR